MQKPRQRSGRHREEDQNQKQSPLEKYGKILGADFSPISPSGVRYFEKNYGNLLSKLAKDARILEIGPGAGAAFAQYLLKKGFANITLCEMVSDSARILSDAFGDRLTVIKSDGTEYLRQSSAKLDCIFSAQVIEHFSYDGFTEFLKLSYASLKHGGYIVFETINTANMIYGTYLRYCDYTHRMGFTPRSLRQFFLATGDFSFIDLMEIHPLGLFDFVRCAFEKTKSVAPLPETSYASSDSRSTGMEKMRKAASSLRRASAVGFSKWLTRFFLKPYEFDGIKVHTPFFAIVGRKA